VLTSQGIFSVDLISAARDIYKYTLIWKKNKPRGHLNAKKQPMRIHEDILVFYKKPPTYNPQMTRGHEPVHAYTQHSCNSNNYGKTKNMSGGGSRERYPTSIIEVPVVNNEDKTKMHPTQKPINLGRWLIRTFTNPGEVVLDNACGSGSFLAAATVEERKYIGMDVCEEYVKATKERLDGLCEIS